MPADPAPICVRLDGELTIASVARHAPELAAAFEGGRRVDLDLESVTHLDGAGLQLLMFAAREGRLRDAPLTVVAASRAVRDALDLVQLDDALQPRGCACSCTEAHA